MSKVRPTPLPYPYYYWPIIGTTLVGLILSLLLVHTHYKNYTDLAYSSFCALTQAVNCDTVAQSPWSIFLGLPVALWGTCFYLYLLLLLIPLRPKRIQATGEWSIILILTILAVAVSLTLAILSTTRIHSWCLLCVATYTINCLLAFTSWIIFQRFAKISSFSALISTCSTFFRHRSFNTKTSIFFLSLLLLKLFLPPYWTLAMDPLDRKISTGITEEGNPWIGAQNPKLIIEEFTDYQCFQCKKAHHYLRQLITQFPENIRLVHHHYPLDNEFNRILAPQPFHVGSGRLALIGIVAGDHNAFWAVNDALYEAVQTKSQNIELEQFAALIGISKEQLAKEMFADHTLKRLQHDIVQGLKHGITGTPSFLVHDAVFQQTLPMELLKESTK